MLELSLAIAPFWAFKELQVNDVHDIVPVDKLVDDVIVACFVATCVSTYVFVVNWVDVEGVTVEVGNEVLKALVPVQVLLFDWIALNVVPPEAV